MNVSINNLYEQIGRLYVSLAVAQNEQTRVSQENDTLRLAVAQNEEASSAKEAPKELIGSAPSSD